MAEEEMKTGLTRALGGVQKKQLVSPMPGAYDHEQVESKWYEWWESQKYFTPSAEKAQELGASDKFVMMVPPPNVTGSLHLGHALTSSIEDCLARWNRMRGKETLWLPGVDHAGIATQSVVEKQLYKNEGLTRHDLGREAFVKKVWDWKENYGGRIVDQFKRMGVSLDWSRMCFTLDDKLSTAVTEAFVRMFDDGVIYRGNRLVNWSCTLRTAISDLEVDYEDFTRSTFISVPGHEGKYEFGVLHSFAYPVADSDEKLIVATTRIETMLGDTAVAVHPEDQRYQHLIGKRLKHPFIPDRDIRVVADPVLVDMNFGTGAVKVTPAHDFNDYECGERNQLEKINILSEDGRINENGGKYSGMKRFDCRVQIQKDLEELGLYVGKEDNTMRIGFCSRSGDVIEPFLKPQWWVKCDDLARRAVDSVKNGELKILPNFHEKVWFQWLENIKDWCISRQLWWGHRCPVYLVTVKDSEGNAKFTPSKSTNSHWVAGRTYEEALGKAQVFKTQESDQVVLEQDEDVLDTWFSSGLFPFSTLGWPDSESPDFKAFYPGNLLETGHDILFFWVARMVMMGLYFTDKLPFDTVYLHAMVRDSMGRKMSKSLGNVIDPYEVIEGTSLENLNKKLKDSNLSKAEMKKSEDNNKKEFPKGIPPCGSDALRFGLLAYTIQGRNINLDIKRVVAYRQFCNKLWNATKFAITNLEGFEPIPDFLESQVGNLADRWILSKLSTAIETVNTKISEYNFGEAVNCLHSFWLHDVCDVYLEAIKPVMKSSDPREVQAAQNTLLNVVEKGLILLHPMMPYVTEELYQYLPAFPWKQESICKVSFPSALPQLANPQAEEDMNMVNEIVHTARSMFSNLQLFGKNPVIHIKGSQELNSRLEGYAPVITTLSKAGEASFSNESHSQCLMNTAGQFEIYLEIAGKVNLEAEIKKLQKKETLVQKAIEGIMKKMNAPSYQEKTPDHVKKEFENKLQTSQEELQKLNAEIEKMRSLLTQ